MSGFFYFFIYIYIYKSVSWTIKGRMSVLIDYGSRRIRVLILGCKINAVAIRPRNKRSLEVRYHGQHNFNMKQYHCKVISMFLHLFYEA